MGPFRASSNDLLQVGYQDAHGFDGMSNSRSHQKIEREAPPDVDELASAPLVDLSSTSHIMDAILNNL